ncbi:MAG: YibE/F family protein, partial [Leuconostoc mesenteroides]
LNVGLPFTKVAVIVMVISILGANLPLLIWFIRLRYSIAMFFNAKLLMMEVVTMLLGMLGILMSIWVASRLVVHEYVKIQSKNMRKGE